MSHSWLWWWTYFTTLLDLLWWAFAVPLGWPEVPRRFHAGST